MRITSRQQLKFFIQADYMMNCGKFMPSLKDRLRNIFLPDNIMRYLVAMRKTSYYRNGKSLFDNIKYIYYYRKYCKLGERLGFSIGYDVFGYGLRIPHYGTIVVGGSNQIGNYSVLHTSICISDNNKKIGDAFYCSTGAKLTSQIVLGNSISIGANSLVNKGYEGDNALIAGSPACYKKDAETWYIRDHNEQKVSKIENLRKQYGL